MMLTNNCEWTNLWLPAGLVFKRQVTGSRCGRNSWRIRGRLSCWRAHIIIHVLVVINVVIVIGNPFVRFISPFVTTTVISRQRRGTGGVCWQPRAIVAVVSTGVGHRRYWGRRVVGGGLIQADRRGGVRRLLARQETLRRWRIPRRIRGRQMLMSLERSGSRYVGGQGNMSWGGLRVQLRLRSRFPTIALEVIL